jgi:hypothetical protein
MTVIENYRLRDLVRDDTGNLDEDIRKLYEDAGFHRVVEAAESIDKSI